MIKCWHLTSLTAVIKLHTQNYFTGMGVMSENINSTCIGKITIEQFSLISLWLTPAIAPFHRPGILIFNALKPVLPNSATASSKNHYSLLKSVMKISISGCLVIIHKHSWCGLMETSWMVKARGAQLSKRSNLNLGQNEFPPTCTLHQ